MLIKVKAYPNSLEEEITKKSEDSFDVKVKEMPIRGEANKAIIRVLGRYFRLPGGKVRLIKGFRKRNKIFEIIL